MTTALIDRVTHHGGIVKTDKTFYRFARVAWSPVPLTA